MKKIVILVCIISIVLTNVVFSVSATETDSIGKEAFETAHATETEIIPDADSVADAEAEEWEPIDVTQQSSKKKNNKAECETAWYQEILDRMDPANQEYFEKAFEEREKILKKKSEEKLKQWYEENPQPNWYVHTFKDVDKYLTEKVYKEAEQVIVNQVAASKNVKASEVSVSINSEGKVVSEEEIVLPKETIFELARIYYASMSAYYESIGYNMEQYFYWDDYILYSYKYVEEDGVWLCFFRTDLEKYPERTGRYYGSMTVAVKNNGEFVTMGE